METYKKYLPTNDSLNEKSKNLSTADLIIDRIDDLMADFELEKDETSNAIDKKKLASEFSLLNKSFEKFKSDLLFYARLADKKIR